MCRALQIYYINIQAFGLKPSSGTNYTQKTNKQTKDKILQRKGQKRLVGIERKVERHIQ